MSRPPCLSPEILQICPQGHCLSQRGPEVGAQSYCRPTTPLLTSLSLPPGLDTSSQSSSQEFLVPNDVRAGSEDDEGDNSLPPPKCSTPQPLCRDQYPLPHTGKALPWPSEFRSRRGCWGRSSWKKRETEAQEGERVWPTPRKSLGM